MEFLSRKLLQILAREHGIPRWSRMTKRQLLEALKSQNITLNNLTVPELRSAAKSKRIRGFHKIRKVELINALTTSKVPGLNNLSLKVLKTIAHEHGINVTHKMTKAELVQALNNVEIILDNLRVPELRSLAKVQEIRGYSKMQREELNDALSAFIPEVELPIPEVQTPPGKLSFQFHFFKQVSEER